MRSLTPCAPAGSPRHRLAGHRHEGTPREWPRPALCTDGHPHHGPQCCASSEGTDPPLVHHSPSRFARTLGTPAALLSSVSILHQHTDSKPQEESPLFIFSLFQQVPEAAHLTKSYLYHVTKALFLPFTPHAAVQSRPRGRRACGQPSASMSGVKFAFPFS